MKPVKTTLNDLLDRIFDKGLVIDADVIITFAGIPLIALKLRAALASIETMLDYGMMDAWDESIRSGYFKEYVNKIVVPLHENEQIMFKTFGSYYYNNGGIYFAWQHGYLYLTNKRLFLFRKRPAQILFETELGNIDYLEVKGKNHLGKCIKNLNLVLKNNKIAILHSENLNELKEAIEKQYNNLSEKSKPVLFA